jgi:hypothetical protein
MVGPLSTVGRSPAPEQGRGPNVGAPRTTQRHQHRSGPHHTGRRRGRRQAPHALLRPPSHPAVDHSKIGQVSTHRYSELTDVDLLITDTGITGTDEKALHTARLTLEKT